MTCGFNAIFITWRIFLAANQNERERERERSTR
jgi:hypothetical protein